MLFLLIAIYIIDGRFLLWKINYLFCKLGDFYRLGIIPAFGIFDCYNNWVLGVIKFLKKAIFHFRKFKLCLVPLLECSLPYNAAYWLVLFALHVHIRSSIRWYVFRMRLFLTLCPSKNLYVTNL